MRLAFDDAGRGDCVVLIHGHPFRPHPVVAAAETEFNDALGSFLRAHAPG